MLTVACVLRSGGVYDATWVARLRDGVKRHLPIEHRFVCLSDVDVPCERIALEHYWPGWWAKIELLKLRGPLLAIDLDTAIVGDLTDIAMAINDYRFIMLRDFYRVDGLGSGMMAWGRIMALDDLYRRFAEHADYYMKIVDGRGDQGFIEDMVVTGGVGRWQELLPGQVASYKVHCRGGIPQDARVVCLHGRPKFADMPATDPVRVAWEMAA